MKTRNPMSLWLALAPALGIGLLLAGIALASSVSVPYEFVPGTPADANQVNANFDALADAINDNDMRVAALETGPQALAGVHAQPSGATVKAFNNMTGGSPIVVTRLGEGEYSLEFGAGAELAMQTAYFQVTKGGLVGPGFATAVWTAATTVIVRTYDVTGILEDSNFYFTAH